MSNRAHILLVHGAWSRASTWDRVAMHLRRSGHKVTAIDLPGHGADPSPPDQVGLQDYADKIVDTLTRLGPCVLVGHSMGGMAISAAAERRPDLIAKLIYVAAFLPDDGQSLLDLIRLQDAPGIRDCITAGPVPGTTVLDADKALDILCQDADASQRLVARSGLGVQPNRAQTDRLKLTHARFARLPKAYVFCEQDKTVTPELQRQMARQGGCRETCSLDCGHLPQLTCPKELAGIIMRSGEQP